MKKGIGKGLKKVIINSIVLILLIVGLGFACVPLFKDLKFGLDLQGGFEVLYQVNSITGELTNDMVTNTYKTISRRIDVLGVSEPSITVEGSNRIRVQLAGITNQEEARKILAAHAKMMMAN